jgi:hypothetical protein
MVMFVMRGVELNPGPSVDQGKINRILAHVRNQDKGSEGIKGLLETHNREIKEISKYKQIKQTVKEWEERQQMADGK